MLEKAFAVHSMPTDADRDYLATQTGMTYKQVTVWFQNNRSRRINALPKRNRLQSINNNGQHIISSHPSVTPPLQTGSSLTSSIPEIEHHLRNPTDSPLAEHTDLPDTSSRCPPTPLPTISESGNLANVESNNDVLENNSNTSIVSRSPVARGNHETSRAFDGFEGALSIGNADGKVPADTSRRPIAPLRKNRLAGKKPTAPKSLKKSLQDGQSPLSCQTTALPPYLQSSGSTYVDSPTQVRPADILNQQNNQQRVPSNGSITEIDRLLGNSSSSRAVSSSSADMLMLPLHALTGRTVSGSTAGEIEYSLDDGAAAGGAMGGMLDVVPMFNFFPPTPSNAGFMNSSHNGQFSTPNQPYPTSTAFPNADYPPTANLQFDPIDFSSLFGFPASSALGLGGGMDADAAAQSLLKDLDELDFGEFLHSPETRWGSTFTEFKEGAEHGTEERVVQEERNSKGQVTMPEGEGITVPYIFQEMDLAKFSDEKEIDPVVFELLRSIMAGTTPTATEQPTNTFLEHDTAGVSGTTQTLPTSISASRNAESRREPGDEPPLNALAIDLSTLLHTTNTTSNNTTNNSPRASFYLQTTPSDVSDFAQFCGTPFDSEVLCTPFATPMERQTVPQDVDVDVDVDVDGKRDSLQFSQLGADEKESWAGLLDFGDMFEAFWSMVDDSPAPTPGS
ncbi:hypothetical protein QFC21_003511 [Naganishia friedmannii]|uniref:Uncharacterized protein n=1 Tax=Naganishia friedmannii TaxID=89922 RepID=A0ACC2VPP2_9TREE|nr:hypothetical protein QFC21_003511 [Naganishia friedmannii]